jgi:hypothetical protein
MDPYKDFKEKLALKIKKLGVLLKKALEIARAQGKTADIERFEEGVNILDTANAMVVHASTEPDEMNTLGMAQYMYNDIALLCNPAKTYIATTSSQQ